MKEEKIDWMWWIIVALAIILTVASFITITIVKSESGKCLQNPIQFAVDDYAKQKNAIIQCSCTNLEKFGTPIIYTSNYTKK